MLSGLLAKSEAISYLYGLMQETAHLRAREPKPEDWATTTAMKEVLDRPYKLVIEAQEHGN
jgi:hypothetical protein